MRFIVLALLLVAASGCDGSSCTFNSECPSGSYCASGACRTDCSASVPCPEGLECSSFGQCVATTDGGRRDAGREQVDAGSDGGGSCEDRDGDGHRSIACGGDDCDDDDADAHPGNVEVCDALHRDEDCDETTFGETDADGDGAFDRDCCNGSRCGDDCDDADAAMHPFATETCDGVDNDCDDVVDEGSIQVDGCVDLDHDLHGDPAVPRRACAGSPDFATVCDDCDDTEPAVYAGHVETCDHLDNDCDTLVDDGVTIDYYADCDGDGHGAGAAVPGCEGDVVPTCEGHDHVRSSDDCDDGCVSCLPGGTEDCDGRDNDCAGGVDDGALPGIGASCTVTGASGVCAMGTMQCVGGAPTCGGPSPSAETCGDGLDNDCDGLADEEGTCVGPTSCSEGTCGFPGNYVGCSACRRVDCQPSVDRTYTEDAFTTCTGSFVIGTSRLVWCGESPCYLQYGPYVQLPVGTYEVTIDVHGNNGWSYAFEYDLSFPDGGATFLADLSGGTPITNGARYSIPGDDARRQRTLRFRVTSACARVEFRARYLSAHAGSLLCTGTDGAFAVNSRRLVRVGP